MARRPVKSLEFGLALTLAMLGVAFVDRVRAQSTAEVASTKLPLVERLCGTDCWREEEPSTSNLFIAGEPFQGNPFRAARNERTDAPAELERVFRTPRRAPMSGRELDEIRARVRIHWDAPEFHHIVYRAEAREASFSSPASPPDLALMGHWLVVSGRVDFIEPDGREVPITWPMHVAVARPRHRGAQLQSRTSAESDETALYWTGTNRNGRFVAHLELAPLERTPGEPSELEFGVCLPALDADEDSSVRVLEQSRNRIRIDGAPVLSTELQLVNACEPIDSLRMDPTAWVRAVNALRELGKDRALDELQRYTRLAFYDAFYDGDRVLARNAANIDCGNSVNAIWLVRLLFDFDDASKQERDMHRENAGFMAHVAGISPWVEQTSKYPGDRYPFILVDDLPIFAPEYLDGSSGFDGSPAEAIQFAREHGTLRANALHPGDDPIADVEAMMKRTREVPRGLDPREQAARMLSNLLDPATRAKYDEIIAGVESKWGPFNDWTFAVSPLPWDDIKRSIAAHGGVHWDETSQRYALGARAK